MLPILLISNYLKREQLAKENQRKVKIRNASSTGAEFLVAGPVVRYVIIVLLIEFMVLNYEQLVVAQLKTAAYRFII